MPVSVWCILIAAILPVAAVFPAKLSKDYDNANPRDPDYWRDGFRSRAQAAQANGFEAFPFFAIAVIVGLGQGGDPSWIGRPANHVVAMRLTNIVRKPTDRATPRSLSWAVGFLSVVGIFTSPVWS